MELALKAEANERTSRDYKDCYKSIVDLITRYEPDKRKD
jgi:hypothetical protein